MDEKFVLNKSNKIMICITIASFLLMVIGIILLVVSYNEEVEEIPYLEITKGKTSTVEKRTTTESTTTSTTTVVVNKTSPYYEINLDEVLKSDLLTKSDVSKEEAKTLVNLFIDNTNKVFNLNNNDLLDINSVVTYAKDGEKDKLVDNENTYGIVYNSSDLFNKMFSKSYIKTLTENKIKGKYVFLNRDGNYYRIANSFGDTSFTIFEVNVDKYLGGNIEASFTCYNNNYKEEGYSSPVYKTNKIELIYETGSWRIKGYKYPLYD